MLHDHIDLRVSGLAKARPLYDALLPALGYTRIVADETCAYYHLPGKDVDFFGITVDPHHRPNGSRIAFAAAGRAHVDALAAIAKSAGAGHFRGRRISLSRIRRKLLRYVL